MSPTYTITLKPGESLTVNAAPATTTPTPTPPSGATVQFPPTDTAAHFASLVKDKTVSVIELDGRYTMPELYLDAGLATDPPLLIQPGLGKTATFAGPGKTLTGQFFFGMNAALKRPTTVSGLIFDGITLAQSGLFEVRRAQGLTIRACTAKNIKRDTTYATRAVQTWFAYISSKGPEGCRDILVENCAAAGTARSWSFLQLDSSEVPAGAVTLRDNACSDMAYALFANIPGGPLTVDGLVITNSGEGGNAVSFRQGTGTYTRIVRDAASGAVQNLIPGSMVAK